MDDNDDDNDNDDDILDDAVELGGARVSVSVRVRLALG